jgi:hypothetical protein
MLNEAPEIWHTNTRRVDSTGLSVHAKEGGLESPDLVIFISMTLKRIDQAIEVSRMFHAIVVPRSDSMGCKT